MKRVLCFLNSLGSGGAERQMAYLSSKLVEEGNEVYLIYYAKNNFNVSFLHPKINVVYVPRRNRFLFCLTLAKLIRKLDVDTIISYLLMPNIYISLGYIFSFKYNVRLIVSERNFNINGLSIKDYCFRLLPFFLARKIVCNSISQQLLLKKKFSFLEKKIIFIGNALDLSLYSSNMMYKRNHDCVKIIFPASFIPSKNHLGLAKAVNIIKSKKILCQFKIFCYGSTVDKMIGNNKILSQSYFEFINYIKENALEKYFVLNKPIPNLYKMYNQFDALVLPSFYEGCPNAVMEGMAAGLPIIASDVSDISYMINNKAGGFLFTPQNPEEIAEKLIDFFNTDYDIIVKMSKHNVERANVLFNFDVFTSSYNAIL